MKFFSKLLPYKRVIAFVLVLVSVYLIIPETTFAINDESDVLKGLAELLGVVISALTFISLLMMKFFGQLLGTNLLTGPEAMQALTPMWVWVRNLTNVLFVIILVGLAFSNLFASFSGDGGGNWTIKEKLPKVIIALVAINFSLLGFKVVIDAVNVGTVAILGLADSRLDADNPAQKEAIINGKTWVIVTKKTYDKIKTKDFTGDTEDIHAGESCTKEHNEMASTSTQNPLVLGFHKNKNYFVCRDFRSQVNDLFCSGWEKEGYDENVNPEDLDDNCLFILRKDNFKTILEPDDEAGQNLFMSFGTVFMHLEKLPALGAQIDSLNGVLLNTLFSSILSIAYVVALVAIFIALLARVIVIWIALVFSPVIIAAFIMGFSDKAGDLTDKLVTHLIMPLKIAAAFAVSFVMMSGMIDFEVVNKGDMFVFGPALSNLGIAKYGFLWQMATIVIFWLAAKWATEGNLAHSITEKLFNGAQELGEFLAKAATINRQIFSVGTGDKDNKFALSTMFTAPLELAREKEREQANSSRKAFAKALGIDGREVIADLKTKTFTSGAGLMDTISRFEDLTDANRNKDAIEKAIDNIRTSDLSTAEQEKAIKALQDKGMSGLEKYIIAAKTRNVAFWKDVEMHKGKLTDNSFYKGESSTRDPQETDKPQEETGSISVNANQKTAEIRVPGEANPIKLTKDDTKNITAGNINNLDDQKKIAIKKAHIGELDFAGFKGIAAGSNIEPEKLMENLFAAGFAQINGIKKPESGEIINAQKLDDDNMIITKKDSSNKPRAVYLADRKTGVPINLTRLGAAGKAVTSENASDIIQKLTQAQNSSDTLNSLGISGDVVSSFINEINNIYNLNSSNQGSNTSNNSQTNSGN